MSYRRMWESVTRSLHTRERGLKSPFAKSALNAIKSLPTRERGLKSRVETVIIARPSVAPYTGAWIEINNRQHKPPASQVAPYTGAWIEIFQSTKQATAGLSRSLHGSVD